jgi:5-oxopent-3-ene-1,2,5-tricarboxylate decarboxylase / 2-hydroxyhepta-2,4-diene-1,7-dioate isomerase
MPMIDTTPLAATFDFAPYRYSGVVLGTLVNDPAALAALGEAVHHAPYKAPPQAPVLYVKPRNTLAGAAGTVVLPPGIEAFEVGASLGLLVGRTACRTSQAEARACIAGLVVVADLSVPHHSFYRPSVRFKAFDGSCRLSAPVALAGLDPDGLEIRVAIDGVWLQQASTRGFVRSAARLLSDVSQFMTLRPGDVLMTGVPFGAPTAKAGQQVQIEIAGVGRLAFVLEARA